MISEHGGGGTLARRELPDLSFIIFYDRHDHIVYPACCRAGLTFRDIPKPGSSDGAQPLGHFVSVRFSSGIHVGPEYEQVYDVGLVQ